MGTQNHHLTIPGTIDNIEQACEFVNSKARIAGLDDDEVYHCHLSVEEVLTNIIEHGYEYNGDEKVIDIVIDVVDAKFVITVIDDASAFDPLSQPEPDPSTPLWEREGGGWGIFFVKKYMDKLSYQRKNNRNYFIMEKALTSH